MKSYLSWACGTCLLGLHLSGCNTRHTTASKASGTPASATATVVPSLKETFQKDFRIGTAFDFTQAAGRDTNTSRLIGRHFNAVTPENTMKAMHLHPEWDRYNFGPADRLVAYAQQNNMPLNGHTLVWHSQLPGFMRRMKNADSVRHFFTDHITTVASRYKGKVYSWDVVNEALNEDGSLRRSVFLQHLGEGYIVEAFRLANQAAPDAELYYNDYNIEQPKKRAGTMALIKKLQSAGVRIDGVGIQGHWHIDNLPLAAIEESILAYAALGVKVMFTELDLTVLPNPWQNNTADIGRTAEGSAAMNPYTQGLPDSVQVKLAKAYQDLFTLFLKHADKITRVTFWGVNDGHSWLNNFPIRGRTNYPLLFDRNNQPKPAFYAVINTKSNNGIEKLNE